MQLTVEMPELVKDQKYQVRIMTRDPKSRRAKELATLPGVELFQGTFASENDLTTAFTGCDGAVSSPSFLVLNNIFRGDKASTVLFTSS